MRLLASADGTTASAAAEAMATETGSGSKSVAHRYLTALRVAGIARLDGSGRGAKFRRADAPRPAAVGPGLTVVPPDDGGAARPPAPGARQAGIEATVNNLIGDAIRLVTEFEFASAQFLARKLRCAPHEAVGLIAALEVLGIIGPDNGTSARDVLVSAADITAAITGRPAAGGDAQ